MIKKLCILICLLVGLGAKSQVQVTLQLPPLGLTIKPQLWNLSLINTSADNMNIRIEFVMTDASNNQQVMTGITNTITLPRGVKQLTVNDVSPVAYNISGSGYGIDASANGFLPVGLFHFCYTVKRLNSDAHETMGDECETVEIEPLSPPQLVMPVDSERVDVTRPFFTWLPPSPFNLFNNLNYDWILTEIMPIQSAADAIQQNIPVLSQSNLASPGFQYPLAMAELDTSKTYAWRVTAKNNSSVIANSEIWTFRVKKLGLDTVTSPKTANYYTKLRSQDDASYTTCSGVLRFEYLNEINSSSVNFRIYDITSPQRKLIQFDSSDLRVSYGQNFIELDLRENKDIKERRIYLLELVNVKGEKWYLKFEYRKPD